MKKRHLASCRATPSQAQNWRRASRTIGASSLFGASSPLGASSPFGASSPHSLFGNEAILVALAPRQSIGEGSVPERGLLCREAPPPISVLGLARLISARPNLLDFQLHVKKKENIHLHFSVIFSLGLFPFRIGLASILLHLHAKLPIQSTSTHHPSLPHYSVKFVSACSGVLHHQLVTVCAGGCAAGCPGERTGPGR